MSIKSGARSTAFYFKTDDPNALRSFVFPTATASAPSVVNEIIYQVGVFDGTKTYLYSNAFRIASAGPYSGGPFSFVGELTIGCDWFSGSLVDWFHGRIAHAAFYDTALSPIQIKNHYDAGLGLAITPFRAQAMTVSAGRLIGAAQIPGPPAFRKSPLTPPIAKQQYYGGAGIITGTVLDDATSAPLHRRVMLYDRRSHVLLRSTWSNPANGAYAFNDLDPSRKFTIVAHDYTGKYNAVVADNVQPEVAA
jgi:hypothetical protein